MYKRWEKTTYPKTVGALRKYLRHSYALPERPVLLGHCLSDIDDFMEMYFSTDFSVDVRRLNTYHAFPGAQRSDDNEKAEFVYRQEPEKLKTTYASIMNDERRQLLRATGEYRSTTEYTLTKEEIEQAKAYLDNNQELRIAVASVQGCLSAYFRGLENQIIDEFPHEMRRTAGKSNQMDKHLGVFLQESAGFSFLHDLLPIMALSLSRGDGGMSRHNLGKALCDAFRMQAFKSQERRENVVQRRRHCPLGQHITTLLSKSLEKDENGNLKIVSGQKPGSLLYSLIELTKANKAEFYPEL